MERKVKNPCLHGSSVQLDETKWKIEVAQVVRKPMTEAAMAKCWHSNCCFLLRWLIFKWQCWIPNCFFFWTSFINGFSILGCKVLSSVEVQVMRLPCLSSLLGSNSSLLMYCIIIFFCLQSPVCFYSRHVNSFSILESAILL